MQEFDGFQSGGGVQGGPASVQVCNRAAVLPDPLVAGHQSGRRKRSPALRLTGVHPGEPEGGLPVLLPIPVAQVFGIDAGIGEVAGGIAQHGDADPKRQPEQVAGGGQRADGGGKKVVGAEAGGGGRGSVDGRHVAALGKREGDARVQHQQRIELGMVGQRGLDGGGDFLRVIGVKVERLFQLHDAQLGGRFGGLRGIRGEPGNSQRHGVEERIPDGDADSDRSGRLGLRGAFLDGDDGGDGPDGG